MGFKFASFGAATVPLSKIVVDKDLNMGPYAIKGVYRPEEWATETLEWGDIPAGEPIPFTANLSPSGTWITIKTFEVPPGDSYKWRFTIITFGSSSTDANLKITADGVELYSISNHRFGTLTVDLFIPAGTTVTLEGYSNAPYAYWVEEGSNVQNLGIVGGAKTFDLTGKWLALGIDMHGLNATVKIHGEEVPYSDYAKYFPLVPTELKFPGGWAGSQERPVLKVYKVA